MRRKGTDGQLQLHDPSIISSQHPIILPSHQPIRPLRHQPISTWRWTSESYCCHRVQLHTRNTLNSLRSRWPIRPAPPPRICPDPLSRGARSLPIRASTEAGGSRSGASKPPRSLVPPPVAPPRQAANIPHPWDPAHARADSCACTGSRACIPTVRGISHTHGAWDLPHHPARACLVIHTHPHSAALSLFCSFMLRPRPGHCPLSASNSSLPSMDRPRCRCSCHPRHVTGHPRHVTGQATWDDAQLQMDEAWMVQVRSC